MLLLDCPYCGPRDETEFGYGGQAHVPYPEEPDRLSDKEWAQYLFVRDNPKGLFAERWVHSIGCRRWFNVLRDTATYEVRAVYRLTDARPALDTAEPGGPR
jgi:sarcosine oxidase, subunit delta